MFVQVHDRIRASISGGATGDEEAPHGDHDGVTGGVIKDGQIDRATVVSLVSEAGSASVGGSLRPFATVQKCLVPVGLCKQEEIIITPVHLREGGGRCWDNVGGPRAAGGGTKDLCRGRVVLCTTYIVYIKTL